MKGFRLPFTLLLLLLTNTVSEGKYRKIKNNLKSPVGPPYAVTASFFRDRYTFEEWNTTLTQFKKQGGDTVFLRAPQISQGLPHNFQWCKGCMAQAKADMQKLELNISAVWSYEYEEGYSDAIIRCPSLDRKIISSRIYHRIILPTNTTARNYSSCDFPKGSNVVLLFTSFAGTDPHQVLVQSAAKKNVSVYLGLPRAPLKSTPALMTAYYAWVERVLMEYKSRYSAKSIKAIKASISKARTLYDSISGYYSADECDLPELILPPGQNLDYLDLYRQLGNLVHNVGKRFAVSPSLNTNKFLINGSLQNNLDGFTNLISTQAIDIVAVREGRGSGKGAYFWPNQLKKQILETDPTLDEILHLRLPKLRSNVTYSQVFEASNQALFRALKQAQQQLDESSASLELWLNVEAYESLYDDPCLPVDTHNSGNGEMMNRASLARVNQGLSAAGAQVQKVASFAWDSDFTCTTHKLNTSLKDEIQADINRPVLADCSFHSQTNLSVVAIGFNIIMGNVFKVTWTDTSNKTRTNSLSGYYFELDYGAEHNLVENLQYTMLYDISDMNVTPKGTIHVTQENSLNDCYFDYDLPNGKVK